MERFEDFRFVHARGKHRHGIRAAARDIKCTIGERPANPHAHTETDNDEGRVFPTRNLFGIPVYLDRGMLAEEIMDFNAGQQTVSMEMKVADYLRVVHPHVTDLSREEKVLSSSEKERP